MDEKGGDHPRGRQCGPQGVILHQGEERCHVGRHVREPHDDIEEQEFQYFDHPVDGLKIRVWLLLLTWLLLADPSLVKFKSTLGTPLYVFPCTQ